MQNIITKTLILTTFILVSAIHKSFACNLKSIPFGNDSNSIAASHDLQLDEEVPIAQLEEATLSQIGNDFCASLPGNSEVTYLFTKNKLTKITIQTKATGDSSPLLEFATDKLGKPKRKRPNKSNPNYNQYQNVWGAGKRSIALYSAKQENGINSEYLEIASRLHRKLEKQKSTSLEQKSIDHIKKREAKREKRKARKERRKNRNIKNSVTVSN